MEQEKIINAHLNTRTKLYVLELVAGRDKTVFTAPRWVKDRNTLEMWLSDRIKDKSVPEGVKINFEM